MVESHKRNRKVKLSERAPPVQRHLAGLVFFFFLFVFFLLRLDTSECMLGPRAAP